MLKQKSFTLIELMVVIAIIGLFSSIVLVSISRARRKAKDARLMADLRQIRSIAELINNTYGTYSYLYDPADYTLNQNAPAPYGDQLKLIEDDITKMQEGGWSGFPLVVVADANRYCVSAELPSGTTSCFQEGWTGMVCIDSLGATKRDFACFDEMHNFKKSCVGQPECSAP